LLLSYISRATRKHSFSLELDRDIFWHNNPKKQEACPQIIKQEINYTDLINKNDIYDNLSQEIPEYMFLGNDSSLDNNDFEYLLAPKHFSL
jgi:hypothetical protein